MNITTEERDRFVGYVLEHLDESGRCGIERSDCEQEVGIVFGKVLAIIGQLQDKGLASKVVPMKDAVRFQVTGSLDTFRSRGGFGNEEYEFHVKMSSLITQMDDIKRKVCPTEFERIEKLVIEKCAPVVETVSALHSIFCR